MSFLGPVIVAAPDGPANPWFSWSYIRDNIDAIRDAFQFHIVVTAEAVGLAMLVALPLAVVAYWVRPLAGPILALSGVLYSIPSLALLAFLAPFSGAGTTTLLISLVIYALLLIIRNALTGLEQVPDDVLDAARGMGYGRFALLWRVELPLALPGIVTGVRLATVSTVALVTVGVLMGEGGLGQLIFGGINANFYKAPILVGTALCLALGLILDVLIAGVGRLLAPWERRAQA
jgi:osmoprotectant transport system permease protein